MVAAAGLAVPRTTVAASEVDAVTWAADLGVPTVVKPVDSAGADGVAFCSTPVEVGKAFRSLHQRVNRMGKVNETVLVQETMEGQQYFINTVSRAGRHRVIEVWADQRRRFPDGVVCDREDLIPPGGRPQEALVAYVIKVLDALAIREGPAHTEVMLTASGPMLIECAARMQGTIVPEAVTAAIGENHVSATVTAASHPQAHDQGAERPYSLLQHLCVVSLIALRDGRMNERGIAGALPGLTTLHSVLSGTAPGQPVQRTVDLFTSPGYLYLLSPDSDQIERDYRRIREAEQGGLYQ
jgi:biotin carboxylase